MISIIVPIYNAERTLERCLKSLQNQTLQDIQVIMIDDGSTDSSSQICKDFCQDNRFEYYYKPNGGVSSARNLGLAKAKGDWIGFCDSDDYADASMYARLYMMAEENGCDMAVVAVSVCKKYENEEILTEIIDSRYAMKRMYLGPDFEGFVTNKLFSKWVLSNILFDESICFCEDTVFVLSAVLKSNKIVCTNERLYKHTFNEGSITRSAYKESYLSVLNACKHVFDMTHEFDDTYDWCAHRFYVFRCMEVAMQMALSRKLNSENYIMLKKIVEEHVDSQVLVSLPFVRRVKYTCFRHSRVLFIIAANLFFVYRAIFVRSRQNH